MENDYEINFLKFFSILKKNKKILLFYIIFIPILITIISFVIPKQYISASLILPPEDTFDPLTYGYSGIGEGMTSGFTKLLGGGATSELWSEILRSRTVTLAVVDSLDLWSRWNLETKEGAIKALRKVISIIITPEGIIKIHIITDDPVLSRDIAYELISNLDDINKNLLQSYATSRKNFLYNRLIVVEDSMRTLEKSMIDFNDKYGLINIELEAEPVITAISSLKSEEILLEAELAGLSSEQTALHPQRRNIQSRLAYLRSKIEQIEKDGGDGVGIGFSVPLENLPRVAIEYAKLKMDYQVQIEIFTLITQEYERAKIAELKDIPSLKIVDWPNVPDEKAYPKKSIFVLVGVFSGIFLGILFVFIKNKLEFVLKNPKVQEDVWNLFYKW